MDSSDGTARPHVKVFDRLESEVQDKTTYEKKQERAFPAQIHRNWFGCSSHYRGSVVDGRSERSVVNAWSKNRKKHKPDRSRSDRQVA
jgi:hypothetical protein